MNTIEQAKKLSNTLKMHPTVGLEADAANTIDALLAELAALKGQEPVAWALPEITQQHNGQIVKHTAFHGYSVQLYLAAGAQSIPSGYQLVPVEPTPEMLQAIWAYKNESLHSAYKAMLAAAPAKAQEQRPLTKQQISEAYYEGTCQQLREQDKTLAFQFSRAIESAHGIGDKS